VKYSKLSITLESEVAEELRRVAGSRGVSAFVNSAVRQRLQAHRVRKMLEQMEEEARPIPEDIQRRVDALPWPD
jgi:hypothetical protein